MKASNQMKESAIFQSSEVIHVKRHQCTLGRQTYSQNSKTYVGKTYLDKSTSPAGVVIKSNICPDAVWYSTCIVQALFNKTETLNPRYGTSESQF